MKHLGMAYAMKNRRNKMESSEGEVPMKMAKGGFMAPKDMAKMIMCKKMAHGGMIDSEDALDEGEDAEMHEEPMMAMEENESMPIDHATDADDFLTPEDDEHEFGKKKDLLTRIMMKMK